jgi:uncharacterized protein YkwD
MREERIPVTLDPPGLRALLSIAVLVAALVPAVALGADTPSVSPADRLEATVLDELNLVRLEHGLNQLRLNPRLTAAADQHSLEMVNSGYFGHESADGSHFARRIKAFYRPRTAHRPWTVGENLIWQARRLTARAAVTSWLASPGHRENLLEPAFREVGIAAVHALGAPGVFGKQSVVVLTVDFGAR